MNFGEKLTSLRKQKGLSQEELGYELNVTRQTVSKWELGQTTPEMDKLVELSKIFGVTVDELTNSEEITNNEASKIEDMPINDKPQNGSTWKVILIIIAVFIIGGIAVYGFVFSKIFNFGKDVFDQVTNQAGDIGNLISGTIKDQIEDFNKENTEIDQVRNEALNQMNDIKKEMEQNEEEFNQFNNEVSNIMDEMEETNQSILEVQDDIKNKQENSQDKFEINSFNNRFEMYAGTKNGFITKVLIDQIITNNKKQEDKIITVIYNGQNINDTQKLTDIKRNFEDFTDYEVSFEYDENGYIYQAKIEKF